MKLTLYLAVTLAVFYSAKALVPNIPSSLELVHHLDDFKKPEIVEAVKVFRDGRSKVYKSSLEILGDDS